MLRKGAYAAAIPCHLQCDTWLVVGRPSAHVDDPAVGQLDVRRLSLEQVGAAERPGVELLEAPDVLDHDETGQDEPVARGQKVPRGYRIVPVSDSPIGPARVGLPAAGNVFG
jgi:hypothetical protein